jgi:hypothetical protein
VFASKDGQVPTRYVVHGPTSRAVTLRKASASPSTSSPTSAVSPARLRKPTDLVFAGTSAMLIELRGKASGRLSRNEG